MPLLTCWWHELADTTNLLMTFLTRRYRPLLNASNANSNSLTRIWMPPTRWYHQLTNMLGSSHTGFTCSPISSLTAQTTNPKPPMTYFRSELVTRNPNRLLKISEFRRVPFIPTLIVTVTTTWARVRRVKTSPTKRSQWLCYSGWRGRIGQWYLHSQGIWCTLDSHCCLEPCMTIGTLKVEIAHAHHSCSSLMTPHIHSKW